MFPADIAGAVHVRLTEVKFTFILCSCPTVFCKKTEDKDKLNIVGVEWFSQQLLSKLPLGPGLMQNEVHCLFSFLFPSLFLSFFCFSIGV